MATDRNGSKKGLSGPLLNQLSQMDGFVHVVRCFENPSVPHPAGSVDPQRDLVSLDSELALNDLIAVERKLERLAEERKKGAGRDKAQIEREIVLFERFQDTLSAGTPLRDIEIAAEEEKTLSGFGLLTRKPVLVVLNLSDGQTPPQIEYPHRRARSCRCRAAGDGAGPAPAGRSRDVHGRVRHPGAGSATGDQAAPTTCSACSPSSPSVKTKCAPGRCGAAPAPGKPPGRSTPTCKKASSAPK